MLRRVGRCYLVTDRRVLLLAAAGWGWTRWFVGKEAAPLLVISLAPAVGAGMLVLAGLVVAKAGGLLGGAAGMATFAVVVATGLFLGEVLGRIRTREGPPAAP